MNDASSTQQWLDRSRTLWDERAQFWNEGAADTAQTDERQADVDRLGQRLRLETDDRVLDAGCGSGQWSVAFASRGFSVCGIDISPKMIDLARENAQSAGVVADFRVGELSSLPYPDGSFEAAISRVVLQFSPSVVSALRELCRVVIPNGRIMVSVPGALSPIYAESAKRFTEPDNSTFNAIVPWELEYVLDHLGWRIVEQWGEFGGTMTGRENELTEEAVAALPPRLQQATATVWSFIAINSTLGGDG